MRRRRFLLFFITISWLTLTAKDWDFTNEFDSPRLFLHPFITYASSIDDDIAWEKYQFARTQFRMNVGSVSLNRLNTNVEARLNHDLDDHLTFRVKYHRQSYQHDPDKREICSMEMEWRLFRNLAVFAGANPEFDKEDVDIVAGIMLADTTRTRYARLTIVYEDFVYDEKNESNGRTTHEPFGVRWQAYQGNGIYTEGYLTEGFRREFNGGDVAVHEGFQRYILFRSTRSFLGKHRYSFDLRFDEYYDSKSYHASDSVSTHRLFISQAGLRNEIAIAGNFHLCPHLRLVVSRLGDYPDYWLRIEFLYALILVYRSEWGSWETGYMAGDREIRDNDMPFMPNNLEHEDKVYLGWNWYFKKNAHLKLSVSHEPSIDGFGGANMQFWMRY